MGIEIYVNVCETPNKKSWSYALKYLSVYLLSALPLFHIKHGLRKVFFIYEHFQIYITEK